jgi:uncharacterized protein (PEP-CTERM system associated)
MVTAMVTAMVMDMAMRTTKRISNRHFLALVIATASCSASAQQASSGGHQVPGSAISGNSATAAGAPSSAPNSDAESSGTQNPRAIVIKPKIKFTETWTDNVSIVRSNNGKESGFITELAPGVNINAKTARLKAKLDYTLLGQFYSTPSGYSRTQNSLNSFGTLEAVEQWLFVDFSGVISQQAKSAFGPQSPSSSSLNKNLTETATYRLSPYIRGQFAGLVEYSLRYNRSTTQASAATVSDIELSEWTGQIRGSTPFQSLRWSLDASQQTADYSLGRKTDAERLYATGTYVIVPQFSVSVSGGRESNNYASANSESHTTRGYGFDWTPTERTKISAFKDRRFFGDGHRFNITHRFARSSISYSDTKDVSVLPNQFASVGLGSTNLDLAYQACTLAYSGQYPDPEQLNQFCTAAANLFLSQLGLSANEQATAGFLYSRATLQRRQQLAIAIQGARNTLTVMFNRNEMQSLFASTTLPDDFSSATGIRQRGLSVNFSHRLTGLTNLNLLASRQESVGTGVSAIEVTTTIYQANLTSSLGSKTTGGLSIRRTESDSTISPYTENALIGTLSVNF